MNNKFLGTVSHGTMRPQDLIPAFLRAIAVIAQHKPEGFNHSHANALQVAYPHSVPNWVVDEGDDCPWWDAEESGWLLETLFEGLNSVAPEGYYFGAHPGDGSDYGFWEGQND